MKTVQVKITRITPCIAAKYLENNVNNRPITQGAIDKYSQEMQQGTWQFNGDTIRIDRNGVLLDGQQRLLAIIDANVSIKVILVTNLDPKVFDTIDIGRPRKLPQLLAMNSGIHPITAAALISLDVTGKYGTFPSRNISAVKEFVPLSMRIKYYLDNRKNIDPATIFAHENSTFAGLTLLPKPVLAYLYKEFTSKNFEQATNFFAAVYGDIGIDIPVAHMLKEKLAKNKAASTQTKLKDSVILAITIKAWNHYRNENVCPGTLTFVTLGEHQEKFPKIQ